MNFIKDWLKQRREADALIDKEKHHTLHDHMDYRKHHCFVHWPTILVSHEYSRILNRHHSSEVSRSLIRRQRQIETNINTPNTFVDEPHRT